ncbi:MAG: HNH endonuclease [Pseudomonadota bacterium]
MSKFYLIENSLDNYWRAIILFGRNVASYKFALAKALLEMGKIENDLVTLEKLAEPFSRHLCEHLKHSPKQITSKSSSFLDACNKYINNNITKDELIQITVNQGFNNVIDAFHIVNRENVPELFFIDERRQSQGIRITENFFKLAKDMQFENLIHETESRWRLVEESWRLNISRQLITVDYDQANNVLFTEDENRRVTITSCRSSLNGYQKGRCFYCYHPIKIEKDTRIDTIDVEVDHFLPWMLNTVLKNINGIWNLVLACQDCNRGENGKFARIPSLKLLKRLHKRNEYLINSHHPLRETLIRQTGINENKRISFLQTQYNFAIQQLIHTWEPPKQGVEIF